MKFNISSSLFLFGLVLFSLGVEAKAISTVSPPPESQALLNFSGNNATVLTKSLKDEHEEKLKKWHMDCLQKSRVDPELVGKLRAGKWKMNNRALKVWVLCMLNNYDLMSMQGVFKLDTAMSLVPRRDWEYIEDVIDFCLPEGRWLPHEKAWEYAKCYHMTARDPKNKKKRFHYMTLFY